jgi:hypothetical protein
MDLCNFTKKLLFAKVVFDKFLKLCYNGLSELIDRLQTLFANIFT